jgi:CHASE3 domain sensor protein/tRNA A-37 threonylcarbamoyl transferase component Bud32
MSASQPGGNGQHNPTPPAKPAADRAEPETMPPAEAPPSEGIAETPTIPPRPAASDQLVEGETMPPRAAAEEMASTDGGTAPVPIPGYEVLGELGRGGMGVVYRARQTKLNRLVALKMILSGGHAGEADLARFVTEAEAIARLQHPNIVQIHEVGDHGGLPFFSLEYCGGGSLDKKLAGTPMPPREAARLVETLARAMQAAHEKGVIHRDLKPANVLLAEDGTPKITDFGLAKKLDEAGQTASGAIMGTPSYMAPEQAGGKSNEIGPAADIYALGAILYECLTGRPPFKAANPLDTILQVVGDDPVPVRRLQPKVPADLEIICLKCLRKEPRKRYGSAAMLAEDLRRFQAGEPILGRPAGRVEPTAKWVKRHPAGAAALAVSVIAAFSFLVGGAVLVRTAGQMVQIANVDQNTLIMMRISWRHQADLVSVVSLLKDAEIGQRGYLLTGDEADLEPYLKAKKEMAPTLERIRRWPSYDPEWFSYMQDLERRVQARFDAMQVAIDLRREKGRGRDAALAAWKTNQGRDARDEIGHLIVEMSNGENKQYETRIAWANRWAADTSAAYNTIYYPTALGMLLALALLLSGVALLILRSVRRWRRRGIAENPAVAAPSAPASR